MAPSVFRSTLWRTNALLDWTRTLFVATYFATTGNFEQDGAIWCLNVTDFPHPPELGRLARDRGRRLASVDHCIKRSELTFFTPMSQTIITANNKPAFVSNLSAFSQSGNEAWGLAGIPRDP
jgi:hypothetical protein